jgi:hypothetical protein
MKYVRKKYWIALFLVAIGLYRFFFLAGKGAISFPDEARYYYTASAIKSLMERDVKGVKGFCKSISSPEGRPPGHAIIRILPMILQGMLYKWKAIDPRNPQSLLIPVIFNIILSLIFLFIFYQITLLLFKNNYTIALLGTLLYSLLANTNIYIRHILPYDSSLLCYFCALYYSLNKLNNSPELNNKDCYLLGGLAAFGFTVYPGYYFFPILIFLIVLFKDNSTLFSRSKFFKCYHFGVLFISVFLFYELIARIGTRSYIGILVHMSSYVKSQGSSEEGFSFLPKYLIEVEGISGIILFILTILYIIKVGEDLIKRKTIDMNNDSLRLLFFTMLVGFLIHASLSAIFHEMSFYGRLVHVYFPFMIWAALSVVTRIKYIAFRRVVYFVMITSSIYSFIVFSIDYFKLAYPRDVLYRNKIDTKYIKPTNIINESKEYELFKIESPPPIDRVTNKPYSISDNKILVNFCFLYPITDDFNKFIPNSNTKLLFRGQHFLTFPAYTYELYSIKERMLLKQRKYQVSIYEIE